MAELKKKYKSDIVKSFMDSGRYQNVMQVPRVSKIVVNMAVDATVDKDTFKHVTDELAQITGQRPQITKARKSISNFKLREGMPIGARVTLRGDRMYYFLQRLIQVTLPRIRDFRGISDKSFDGRGNYSLGVSEQTIFPEIDADKVKRNQGMDITIVTTAGSDEEAKELLTHFGMPFAKA